MSRSKASSDGDIETQVNSFEEMWEFYKFRQDDLSTLSKAFVEEDQTAIADVNGKKMIFKGIGFSHPDIKKVLTTVGAAFNPLYVSKPPVDGSKVKEYRLSVRYPWAQDRVM